MYLFEESKQSYTTQFLDKFLQFSFMISLF
jgi:hypothetical protein